MFGRLAGTVAIGLAGLTTPARAETDATNTDGPDWPKQYDRERSTDPIRKLYNTVRWFWVRKNVLARDRICVRCRQWAAEEADHAIPARKYVRLHGGDMNRFYDESNLQGLCKPCHSSKTATEDGGGWQ